MIIDESLSVMSIQACERTSNFIFNPNVSGGHSNLLSRCLTQSSARTGPLLDHFGRSAVEDRPGMDELKSAGLLRKGQILGGLGELASEDGTDEDTDDLLDETDLLDTEFEDQFADEFESDTDED